MLGIKLFKIAEGGNLEIANEIFRIKNEGFY